MSRSRRIIHEMNDDGDEGDYKIVPGGRGPMMNRAPKWRGLKVGDQIRVYRDPLPDQGFFLEPVAKSSVRKTEHIYVVQKIDRVNGVVRCTYGKHLNGALAGVMSLSHDLPDISPV